MTPAEAHAALKKAIELHGNYMTAPSTARLPGLQKAIRLYESVLAVYTEHDFPVQWAKTQNNLAIAYADLPTGDRAANLQRAIDAYQAALRVRTERDFPVQWAATQNNLAIAYADLPTGDRAANLQRAIDAYQAALRVYTERDFPAEWAMTQNNLAIAYRNLPTGDRAANLQRAIDAYQAALRVRTPDQFPFDCQQTSNNLGDLFYGGNVWDRALDSYAQVIVVTEGIRAAALDEAGRRRVLQQSWRAFERAGLSALRTRQYSLALTLTERGKTRNLADQLWQRDLKPQGVPEEEWQRYQEQLSQAYQMERGLPAAGPGIPDQPERERGAAVSGRHLLDQMHSLRETTRQMEARFAQADPDYVPFARPLDLKDLVELARQFQAVIVEFRVTSEGTFIFLLGPEDKEVTSEQVVEIQDFNDGTLGDLLVRFKDGKPVDGWLMKYDLFRRHQLSLPDWLACVEQATQRLYQQWLEPVHQRLRQLYPEAKRLVLVPNKGLSWLPLHAGWWQKENGERHYLLDEYEIAYAPSCRVLKSCLRREQTNGSPARNLFAVQNPDGSLAFADWEVEEICHFFPEENRRVLKGSQATKAAVKEGMRFGEEKLLSCHGLFDLVDVEQSHLGLYRGRLRVSDIVAMNLRGTWLAVMSACETGLTDIRDIIDEYQGLTAAFLVAGAQTVVPSLWSVNDFSTALLMRRFHSNLYEQNPQMDKASALCEAQRWLRDLKTEEVEELLQEKLPKKAASGAGQQRMSELDVMSAVFHLRDLAKGSQGRPFANPHWWAAFQCVGAGWSLGKT